MAFFNKNAQIGVETVIFIILNLVFFLSVVVFLYNSSNGAALYEQAYAKQMVLLIDSAKPDSTILVNIQKGTDIAKKNGVDLGDVVKLNKANNEITVKFSKGKGYTLKYFSGYDVNLVSNTVVRIEVKENPSGGQNEQ